jgi:hypothetical protein
MTEITQPLKHGLTLIIFKTLMEISGRNISHRNQSGDGVVDAQFESLVRFHLDYGNVGLELHNRLFEREILSTHCPKPPKHGISNGHLLVFNYKWHYFYTI